MTDRPMLENYLKLKDMIDRLEEIIEIDDLFHTDGSEEARQAKIALSSLITLLESAKNRAIGELEEEVRYIQKHVSASDEF